MKCYHISADFSTILSNQCNIFPHVMLVQLVKISQRIGTPATLPAVKDIVFFAVTYVLFH